MAAVLALVDDIFFQAKILETARQLGIEMRACATAEALLDAAAALDRGDVRVIVCGSGAPSPALLRLVGKYELCVLRSGLTDMELARQLAAADPRQNRPRYRSLEGRMKCAGIATFPYAGNSKPSWW